jgi:hypothetical protein
MDELTQEINRALEFYRDFGFYPSLSVEAWLYLRAPHADAS